ncbi:hypothetical protein G7054_g14360 [Neopestalotiopsis clavispora]|nr:hypothetical protein G7054_g14360 [Neopestalotiopsis clavispora]
MAALLTSDCTPAQSNLSATAAVNNKVSQSFRESKISVCVDVSGSTYGKTLEVEKYAIQSVCSLIPGSIQDNITILPWSDDAERPLSYSMMDRLQSNGGTDPNVLLHDPECRLRLQNCGFWFLMTDGQIFEETIREFARNLTGYGMHGKACIISIFGERVSKPSKCNITVGLSVFAVSPHVALLYTDTDSRKTFVLSTKGCFSTLLPPNKGNPKLDYDTTWDELPQVSYENLTRVSIPDAQVLGKDEISLQGNKRVNIPGLFSQDTIDEELMREIMLNEDNMKSIAISAKLRGESQMLGEWLDKVDLVLDSTAGEEDIGSTESQLLKDVEANLRMDEHPLPPTTPLRGGSHISNAGPLPGSYSQIVQGNTMTPTTLMKTGVIRVRRISTKTYAKDSSDMLQDCSGTHFEYLEEEARLASTLKQPQHIDSNKPEDVLFESLKLRVPGFMRPTKANEHFSGCCAQCKGSNVVLVLVLRPSPKTNVTQHFPPINSLSKLVYPLTMGNYAEMDIIADTIVCDDCAAKLARTGLTSTGEAVAGVLPCVSYAKNHEAWLQTINIATGQRFSRSDLALVWLGILYTKLERILHGDAPLPDVKTALRWECNMIQSEVVLEAAESSFDRSFGSGLLQEALLRNFRDSLEVEKTPLLLSYPLDGFVVANAALSNSKHSGVITQVKRQRIVFIRFLAQVFDNYRAYGMENGEAQHQAAKALTLTMDDPRAPHSLFKWSSLRHNSFRIINMEEWRKHLKQNIGSNRYRLSLSVKELLDTPYLTDADLSGFRRLGPLFNWIERDAAHAIAVFVHHMMRSDLEQENQFRQLRECEGIREALENPGLLGARDVERLIESLVPLA